MVLEISSNLSYNLIEGTQKKIGKATGRSCIKTVLETSPQI